MQIHSFTLIMTSSVSSDALADALFDAGFDDALVGTRDGFVFVDVDRESDSLFAAIMSAIDQAGGVGGVSVIRVEPDQLVSASEIAARTGRTRQSVSQLISGVRGPGAFPPPVVYVGGSQRLWRWTDVATWFAGTGELDSSAYQDAWLISALNSALELRAANQHLASASEREAIQKLARIAV